MSSLYRFVDGDADVDNSNSSDKLVHTKSDIEKLVTQYQMELDTHIQLQVFCLFIRYYI
jgi:hypothetical protein